MTHSGTVMFKHVTDTIICCYWNKDQDQIILVQTLMGLPVPSGSGESHLALKRWEVGFTIFEVSH